MKIVVMTVGLCVTFCWHAIAQISNSAPLTQNKLDTGKPWEFYAYLHTNSTAAKTKKTVEQPSLVIINTNTYPFLHTTDGRVYEFMGFDYVEPDGI
jgi:hypothetical protein